MYSVSVYKFDTYVIVFELVVRAIKCANLPVFCHSVTRPCQNGFRPRQKTGIEFVCSSAFRVFFFLLIDIA